MRWFVHAIQTWQRRYVWNSRQWWEGVGVGGSGVPLWECQDHATRQTNGRLVCDRCGPVPLREAKSQFVVGGGGDGGGEGHWRWRCRWTHGTISQQMGTNKYRQVERKKLDEFRDVVLVVVEPFVIAERRTTRTSIRQAELKVELCVLYIIKATQWMALR